MLDCFRNAAAAAKENFFNNIRRMCNLIKKFEKYFNILENS